MMILLAIRTFWFLLPAEVATMTPVFAAQLLPGLNLPVDFGLKFREKRLFGDHKTYRGLVTGVLAGTAGFYLQQRLAGSPIFQQLSLIDYSQASLLLGFSMSLGALVGDLVKSFFKRQKGIQSGDSWFPLDQIDWVAGALVFVVPWLTIPLAIVVFSPLFGVGLHLASKVVGYWVGINQDPI